MTNAMLQRYFRHGTLPHLRVFEAVARHGNYTRAGHELHMAQPTVSIHIKKLTDLVGVPLLEQLGKRVRLTAAGEAVHATCATLFRVFSELDQSLADIASLRVGKLRIATTASGEYLLPPLLADFVRAHPGIEVSLHVDSHRAVLDRLSQNADDLYLLTNPPEDREVVAHAILPNPLIVLAPAGHPLARDRDIPFERLAQERLLVREVGSGTRLAVDRVFAGHRLQPAMRMELGSNETIKEAVMAGLGVSLMYRHSFGFDFDTERLALLDVRGVPQDASSHIVYPAAAGLSLAAQTFVTFACSEARRIFEARIALEPPKGQGLSIDAAAAGSANTLKSRVRKTPDGESRAATK
jgi:DNA-binding transcriptional LysR family regulator